MPRTSKLSCRPVLLPPEPMDIIPLPFTPQYLHTLPHPSPTIWFYRTSNLRLLQFYLISILRRPYSSPPITCIVCLCNPYLTIITISSSLFIILYHYTQAVPPLLVSGTF